ncbi:MAG: peptide deformylase [Collinsella sp.]
MRPSSPPRVSLPPPPTRKLRRTWWIPLLSIEDAACLAANQIGVTKAICALADDEGNTLVMYNPKVLFGMGAFKAEESCLTREGSVR